ncbi:hypothetical protein Dcar01_00247 [Deinococcus carri]|uniref:FAS1 domain-containing protein n=1 Tax=Deinococcus carri TaxID=1211323 RepID=A0ABP9W3F7_9DEIO
MKKQTSLITLSLMLATPALAGGAGAPAPRATTPATCRSIAQIVMTDPQFSTLRTAVEAAGLTQALMGGQYTLFAPTNAAFAKLPSDTLAQVLNDPDMLGSVLLYHVVPGKVTARQVMGVKNIKTSQGANLAVRMNGSRVMVGSANVTRADITACNGVIHVIDAVLVPPAMMATAPMPMTPAPAPTATTPAPAAPAPAAPTAPMGTDISRIPALPLSGATVSGSTVGTTITGTTTTGTTMTTGTAATSTTTTGTATTATTTTDTTTGTATDTATATTDTTAQATTTVQENTLYDVIVADDRFSTFRDLLSDAGLTETLTDGDYTIFAPTNEAFDALPEGTLATLEANPELLRQVLSYHIVQGRVSAGQLASGTSLNAMAGGALPTSMNGNMQMIGTAGVTGTVTTASNGTIYVINQVLMPPGLTLPAATTETSTSTTPADTSTAATGTATTTTTTTATVTTATPATTTPATGTATATTTTTPPVTGSTSTSGTTSANNTTLATLIASDPRFTTLAQLVRQAGLADTLASGEYTIFAPTNEAFNKVAPADLAALSADPARLRQVLLYHVVQGRITGTALAGSPQLTSVQGGALTLTRSNNPERTMIGNAIITGGSSIDTGNGTLYVIDTVLMPAGMTSSSTAAPATTAATTTTTPAAGTSTTTTTPATGTAATGTTTTTPATGTATTGTTTTTGTAAMTTTTPPVTGSTSTSGTTSANNTTLATLIASDPRFTTLAQLVRQAGLADTLASGEYTIFAPTNEAFNKVAPADLTALSADPARLRQVLLYHVVQGRITGTALASSPQLTSVQGGALALTRTNNPERNMIGNAIITGGSSIDTGNGTLYVIDTVLMPPAR